MQMDSGQNPWTMDVCGPIAVSGPQFMTLDVSLTMGCIRGVPSSYRDQRRARTERGQTPAAGAGKCGGALSQQTVYYRSGYVLNGYRSAGFRRAQWYRHSSIPLGQNVHLCLGAACYVFTPNLLAVCS